MDIKKFPGKILFEVNFMFSATFLPCQHSALPSFGMKNYGIELITFSLLINVVLVFCFINRFGEEIQLGF